MCTISNYNESPLQRIHFGQVIDSFICDKVLSGMLCESLGKLDALLPYYWKLSMLEDLFLIPKNCNLIQQKQKMLLQYSILCISKYQKHSAFNSA